MHCCKQKHAFLQELQQHTLHSVASLFVQLKEDRIMTVHCSLPACVIVDFKQSTLPTHERMLDQLPPTCVPVPVITDRHEKKCCTASTVPLRVSKAVTMCKSQGMTVGPGHDWERSVVTLPREN